MNNLFCYRSSLGVDIDPNGFTLANVQKRGKTFKLNKLEFGFFSDGNYQDTLQIGKNLKQLLQYNKITNTKVYMAISEEEVVIRKLKVPVIPDSELEQVIRYELDQNLILPWEEVIFDWFITKKEVNQLHILIIAVSHEVATKYCDICQYAGLTLKKLEVDVFSLLRSLKFQNILSDNKPEFTITLGMKRASVMILFTVGGDYIFSRSYSFTKGVKENQKSLAEELYQETERSLEYFNSEENFSFFPRNIYIIGDKISHKDLIDIFQSRLGLKPDILNTFNQVVLPDNINLREDGVEVALGLSLRRWF